MPTEINLATDYMGLRLKSPLVVAACTVSASADRVRQAEHAGVGAVVLRSLFEEQITFNRSEFDRLMDAAAPVRGTPYPAEAGVMPRSAEQYLLWATRLRGQTAIPLIGSLNARTPGAWVEYAKRLEEVGLDALEINVYQVSADLAQTATDVERGILRTLALVRKAVQIPIAVKLSPHFTALPHFANQIAGVGASALVLFNRFLQPDIDPEAESLFSEIDYSDPGEIRLALRWVALLHGRLPADLALSGGVHSGIDIAKGLLAGAAVTQVASAFYLRGVSAARSMLEELAAWMTAKNYSSPADFRGKLSLENSPEPSALERAQYVKLLLSQR